MYESFFGFSDRPFPAAPRPERYFPATEIEQARQTLMRTVESGAGPGLIIGAPGTGKTLLCAMLTNHFRGTLNVVSLSAPNVETPKELLQCILFELQLPYKGLEESELRLSLIENLQPGNMDSRALVMIIDEAHNLPLKLLEEIRLITNLVHEGQPRVRLVLAGNTSLEEKFAHPKLESFNQRVVARCYLHAFNRDETLQYIQAQLSVVQGNPTLFQHDAQNAIHDASDGVPRLINQIADHALMLASMKQQRMLTLGSIEEAWSDLQQLPPPWQDQGSNSAQQSDSPSMVEFGSLDEDDAQEYQLQPSSNASASESSPPVSSMETPVSEFQSDWDEGADETNIVSEVQSSAPAIAEPVQPQPVDDPFNEPFEEQYEVADPFLPLESTQVDVGVMTGQMDALASESHDANSFDWAMESASEVQEPADELPAQSEFPVAEPEIDPVPTQDETDESAWPQSHPSLDQPTLEQDGLSQPVTQQSTTPEWLPEHPTSESMQFESMQWVSDDVTPVEVVNDMPAENEPSMESGYAIEQPTVDPVLPESEHWNLQGEPAIVPFQDSQVPDATGELVGGGMEAPPVAEPLSQEQPGHQATPPQEPSVQQSPELAVSEQVSQMQGMLQDDRDLLVVTDDEELNGGSSDPTGDDEPPKRQSYDQLFAKLRRG